DPEPTGDRTTMTRIIFWFSFGFVFYIYAGYPLLLVIWRLVRVVRISKSSVEPLVTLLLVAHNERETIVDKISNCLQLDYPPERLQFIVSLDGPTDGTDQIVRSQSRAGIVVVHCEEHQGKAAAINRGMEQASGDVVVFVDARQRLNSFAIRELVANFS